MNVPVFRPSPPNLRRGHPAEPSERARILIVDDDERNLLAIRTVLEDIADVVLARSGEDALRQLLKGEFAVILLDVYMPGMDGYETAQIIRAREQTKRIPIIFLSAVNKETEHLIRGYSMGAVDYVFKPVEPVVLRSKATVFVDLYMMTREVRRKARQEQELLDANLRANAERLRAEQELRLAEQRQAAIIQSLPLVLYLEDREATPRMPKFVSGNFTAVTGFAYEDLGTQPTLWLDRLHPEDRERVIGALQARRDGRAYAVEYRWLCADGSYKHFLDQAVLLRDAKGNPLEYAGTLLDVTDRKNLETQLLHVRKMDALGQLTGGIAHDFNNLLAAVLGGLGLIERRIALADDQRKVLEMTRHAAQQGAELVSRLLAFARKQKLEPARVEMDNLSGTVTQLLTHTLGGLVALEWELQEGLWSPYADETQLELALMNLVINARDAMPEGGKICIACRNASVGAGGDAATAGDYVVLAVSDTGCGIAPEMLERVTEPFFTTKAVGKGTGLGLSMVYGFAQQSGGTMRLESRLDHGTTVELWLPRSPEAARRPPASAPADGPDPRKRARNILLVDDHEGVRATTAAMLEDLGHQVTTAADGEHVSQLIQGDDVHSIDFIISDYAMPLVSGSEVIRKLRAVKPGLPGIIISGYADTAAISGAPEGVIVVSKPFTPAQLQDAIAAAGHVGG
ncbi:response regulator [Frateuria hangzhouensis]|uniref:response regulator n=1 Tax=Frateuria hangzhouensis TaxID=2995589 RepID=UPI0022608293|nr:response regulator [Frateuria sp. STR12]MCX7515220.1 response regulator [Frateuria sp. STR12]